MKGSQGLSHLEQALELAEPHTNHPCTESVCAAGMLLPALHALPKSLLPPQRPCMKDASLLCAVSPPAEKDGLQQNTAPVLKYAISHPCEHTAVPAPHKRVSPELC